MTPSQPRSPSLSLSCASRASVTHPRQALRDGVPRSRGDVVPAEVHARLYRMCISRMRTPRIGLQDEVLTFA